MGRKKGFLDKRSSVTYSLIHSSAPSGEQPERLWVEKSRGVSVGRPDPASATEGRQEQDGLLPASHPLAWLSEGHEASLTDEKRRAIVDLGLPDDGYDYLQHLRDPRVDYAPDCERQAGASLEGERHFLTEVGLARVPSGRRRSTLSRKAAVQNQDTCHSCALTIDKADFPPFLPLSLPPCLLSDSLARSPSLLLSPLRACMHVYLARSLSLRLYILSICSSCATVPPPADTALSTGDHIFIILH